MKIIPLAFDSFSTRSEATLVETKKLNILIDPGIAIGPSRYGLPPAPIELNTLEKGRKLIINKVKKCKVIIITHYHYDHHPYPDDDEFNEAAYKNKIILTKDGKNHINLSQKKRAFIFNKIASKLAKEIHIADNNSFVFNNIKIEFSPPVFHGPEKTRLGYVVMASVKEGNKKFVHGSDAQGPVTKKATDWMIKQNPNLLLIDGPPTYFLGWKFSYKNLELARKNVIRIMKKTKTKNIIVDHHLLRDLKYKEKFEVYEKAKKLKVKIQTAAEYLGKRNLQLEAHRKELMGK